ncbi:MAG TPA: hypothetical protein VJI12_00725 [archaeon]|nr:hypothetical protein [archaeon]
MKIDISYHKDGFSGVPVGGGSYIDASIYAYRKCTDMPDFRAGKGWPLETISRQYDGLQVYQVLFGQETIQPEESSRRLASFLNGQMAISGEDLTSPDNTLLRPLKIFETKRRGVPISIHKPPYYSTMLHVPIAPDDEWITVDFVSQMADTLVFYALSHDFIDTAVSLTFRHILLDTIKFSN